METELLTEIRDLLKNTNKIVSCPVAPYAIPGSDNAVTIETGDTIGFVFKLAVPKSGEIRSALLLDRDDEGVQVDLEIFKQTIADAVADAAFAPTDVEGLSHVCELNFVSFDDHGLYQTSQITNIGMAYTAPEGFFHIQAINRGGITLPAGVPHKVQLHILSTDPTFEER